MTRTIAAITALSLAPFAELPAADPGVEIRAGFIGLDSSHCTAFTELLHREGCGSWLPIRAEVRTFL